VAQAPKLNTPSNSPLTRILAGTALLIVIAVLVISTVPGGCERRSELDTLASSQDDGPRIERVTIKGKTFNLELVADDVSRQRGLGGRDHIPEDGGMLFAFRVPRGMAFVMRDCLVPIDIIFIDHSGTVTATHSMVPEEPRREDETQAQYESRLKRYSSRFVAQFAIELAGGQIEKLGIKPGDKIDLDVDRLERLAE